jgi:hypothetical protein
VTWGCDDAPQVFPTPLLSLDNGRKTEQGHRHVTSISPKRLNEPAIENYAFINLMFQGSVFGFAAENGEYPMGDIELRSKINDKYFDWPSEVTAETLSILNNMTDQTFEGLCAILSKQKPTFSPCASCANHATRRAKRMSLPITGMSSLSRWCCSIAR